MKGGERNKRQFCVVPTVNSNKRYPLKKEIYNVNRFNVKSRIYAGE